MRIKLYDLENNFYICTFDKNSNILELINLDIWKVENIKLNKNNIIKFNSFINALENEINEIILNIDWKIFITERKLVDEKKDEINNRYFRELIIWKKRYSILDSIFIDAVINKIFNKKDKIKEWQYNIWKNIFLYVYELKEKNKIKIILIYKNQIFSWIYKYKKYNWSYFWIIKSEIDNFKILDRWFNLKNNNWIYLIEEFNYKNIINNYDIFTSYFWISYE